MTNHKVEFIKTHVKDFEKINPYLDFHAIESIKKSLCENGFYKSPANQLLDESIIRLILLAQGKDKPKNTTANNRRRFR